jgi:hypothetical protein
LENFVKNVLFKKENESNNPKLNISKSLTMKKKGGNMGKYAIKRVRTLHKFKMFRMSIYQVTKMNCHLYACKKMCF